MSILFIADDLITPFTFWHDGHLATGIHFRQELWGRVLVAPYPERQRFFHSIEALNAQGIDVMITASKDNYKGWVNLRSPLANSLLAQSVALAKPALPHSSGSVSSVAREALPDDRSLALQVA
jgi:hypothetical protein